MNLQKAPLGLLGWFALKVGGRNPPAFGDAVTPIVDVADNYLALSELGITSTTTAIGLNNFFTSTIAVPAGKCWRLFGLSIITSLNGADAAITASARFATIAPTGFGAVLPSVQAPAAIRTERYAAWYSNPPFFLPTGWKVQLNLDFSAALTNSVSATALVLRQEIDV